MISFEHHALTGLCAQNFLKYWVQLFREEAMESINQYHKSAFSHILEMFTRISR